MFLVQYYVIQFIYHYIICIHGVFYLFTLFDKLIAVNTMVLLLRTKFQGYLCVE